MWDIRHTNFCNFVDLNFYFIITKNVEYLHQVLKLLLRPTTEAVADWSGTHLEVRVQQTYVACVDDGLNTVTRCAVQVALVLSVLQQFASIDIVFHLLSTHEEVLLAVHLACSR